MPQQLENHLRYDAAPDVAQIFPFVLHFSFSENVKP